MDRGYAGVNSFGTELVLCSREKRNLQNIFIFKGSGKAYIKTLEAEVKGNKTYEETKVRKMVKAMAREKLKEGVISKDMK